MGGISQGGSGGVKQRRVIEEEDSDSEEETDTSESEEEEDSEEEKVSTVSKNSSVRSIFGPYEDELIKPQKKLPEPILNQRSPSPGTTQQAYVDFGSVEFNIWNSPTPPPSNTGEQLLNKALPLVPVSPERTPSPHTDATQKHSADEYFSQDLKPSAEQTTVQAFPVVHNTLPPRTSSPVGSLRGIGTVLTTIPETREDASEIGSIIERSTSAPPTEHLALQRPRLTPPPPKPLQRANTTGGFVSTEDLLNRLILPPGAVIPRQRSASVGNIAPTNSLTRTNSYRLKEMNTLRRSNTADPKRSPSLRAVSFKSGSSPRPASEHLIFGGEDEDRRRFFDTTSREVFETWGDREGGASSPVNKPASLRKRQSLQVLDLENQVFKLTTENTELEHQKAQLTEESNRYRRQVTELDDSLDKQKELLAKRDRELLELQESVAFYRKEVTRLSEANDSLGATNNTIQDAFKKDIAQINKKYDRKREQLIQLSKEHTELSKEHSELSKEHSELQKQYSDLQGGMEKIIRQEIKVAIQDKDAEIDKLKDELGKARLQVKRLQKEGLAAAAEAAQQIAHAQETGKKEVNKYLNLKPEEYFPTAWKDFTDSILSWCGKFSRGSERSCLSLHRIADEWVRDRVEVVMLDDAGVRRLLKDKTKREVVLAAVVMRIIREAVFTRYLFGLTAEERQKLNGLERHLTESGPPSAVNLWRATTLTLLSQRPTFQDKRTQEAGTVVKDIVRALSGILPQPTQLPPGLVDELRAIVATAVQLSIEMRTQRAQYMVPAPPNPVYDNNGDNVSKVIFTRKTMKARSEGAPVPREEDLERERALVKLVVFPFVVQIGTQNGESYDEEKVVVPMDVCIARPGENNLRTTSRAEVPPMPPLPGRLSRSATSAPGAKIESRERERERERDPVPGRLSRSTTSTNIERDHQPQPLSTSTPRTNGSGTLDPSEPRPGRIRRADTIGAAPTLPQGARGDREEIRREREYRERERQRRAEERERRAQAGVNVEDETSSSAGASARRVPGGANRMSALMREGPGGLSPVPEGSPESMRVGRGVLGERDGRRA